MKTILIILFALFTLSNNAQTLKIKDVKPTTWVKVEVVTDNHTEGTNKGVGAAIGSGVGYLLTGGLFGLIGGAVVGSSVSDGTHVVTTTHNVNHTISGYLVTLSDGGTFRTFEKYTVGQYVDISKVVKQ